MAKGGDPAPKPDPRIGEAALKQAELGEEFLAFSKEQFGISNERQAEIDALTKRFADQQFRISEEDRARYENVFRPIEDRFIQTAEEYSSPEKQAQAAAEAKAGVQSELAAERGAAERRAFGLGISPASGRFEGIDRAVGLGGALASVDAQNRARQDTRDRGLALTADAINIGKGLPASSQNAGAVGLGANLDAANNARANTGIVSSGYQGASAGYGNMADTLNMQYGNQLKEYQINQQNAANNAAGVGSFLGTGVGLLLSSKKAKTGKKPLKEGEALEAVRGVPVEAWNYKPGMGADGGESRHVGPYAEDMKRETGSGDGKMLKVADVVGVTMAALKDLDTKVERIAEAVGLGGAMMGRAA